MARRLDKSPSQIDRGRLIYEMHRDGYSHLDTTKVLASRHKGGDQGKTPWHELPVGLQEHFVRIGDAVAKLTLEQSASMTTRKTAQALEESRDNR